MNSSALPWYVKLVLRVAIPAACLAALYLSIPGEIAMARTAGWSENYAYAMPVCVSVYALAAAAIAAYRRRAQLPGQVTALIGAGMALVLAMCAQSISHLMAQDYMGTSALLVVAVSAVPPLVIAHMMHMAETPSQVKTAAEEMEELRAVILSLTVEVAGSLLLGSRDLARECDYLAARAGELSQETEETSQELHLRLVEAGRKKGGSRGAVPLEEVEAVGRELKRKGVKITGPKLAEALGIAESTAYRYRQAAISA
ncbi:hypothetical protein ABCR94_23900 [Streptomyces sp. 21So2-11]|uniref:hypothetical protein n=1 Tax=Streptomyces sp. 21So2-11 TaxID=3144408 RepID=UPI00321A5B73